MPPLASYLQRRSAREQLSSQGSCAPQGEAREGEKEREWQSRSGLLPPQTGQRAQGRTLQQAQGWEGQWEELQIVTRVQGRTGHWELQLAVLLPPPRTEPTETHPKQQGPRSQAPRSIRGPRSASKQTPLCPRATKGGRRCSQVQRGRKAHNGGPQGGSPSNSTQAPLSPPCPEATIKDQMGLSPRH